MKVYAVFHSDIEEGSLRAIFLRQEDAAAHCSMPDRFDNWIIARAARERMASGSQPEGFKPDRTERWESPSGVWHERQAEAVYNFPFEMAHGDWCCSVIEHELVGSA